MEDWRPYRLVLMYASRMKRTHACIRSCLLQENPCARHLLMAKLLEVQPMLRLIIVDLVLTD